MKGMILAAGFGTRFRPVTYQIPKPMVPLCNRPLIGYAIESLLGAGVDEIIINLHHLPETLESFVRSRYGSRVGFQFSLESRILGTGGGIRNVRHLLEREKSFFLINGDTVQFPPFEQLKKRREETGAIASLLLRHPPQGDRFTAVMYDGQRITGFNEGVGQAVMFAGSHCISSRIFALIPDREFSGITEDVYIPMTRSGEELLTGIVHDGLWFDIGTPRRYLDASHALSALMIQGELEMTAGSRAEPASMSMVSTGARNEGHVDRVVLGDARVESGATILHSVVWDGARIESGATVEDSIISHDTAVPAGAKVQNALVAPFVSDIEYASGISRFGDLVAVAVDPSRPFFVS